MQLEQGTHLAAATTDEELGDMHQTLLPSSTQEKAEVFRIIKVGAERQKEIAEYTAQNKKPPKHCTNEIKTSKYTINPFSLHFIIWKNIAEQFRRAANVYFLFIAVLQMIPGLSPTGRYTTIMPLSLVLFLSLLKDAYEDFKRHRLDNEMNHSMATVLRDGQWVEIWWKDVAVGDLLRVDKGGPFPADLLLLFTPEPEGLCYIETSSLDGETNLKIRKSATAGYENFDVDHPEDFSCVLKSELPNNRLYNFSGTILIKGAETPITNESILLRGAALRNTRQAFGVVIFTGQETKLMKNSAEKEHKMSNMDHITNKQVFFIFFLQLFLAIGCCFGLGIFTAKFQDHWYLADSNADIFFTAFLGLFTFLILFNNVIPISLYVSMEFVKLVQAFLIGSDVEMYHKDTDTPAMARTSALNEELGQVTYIFSDKTGTLTCNIMDFLKFTCLENDGSPISYGKGITEIAKAAALREHRVLVDPRPAGFLGKEGFCFYDERVMDGAWTKQKNATHIRELLVHLAVCHTVVAEYDDATGKTIYQAASPDEGCLVKAAKELGVVFVDRTERSITISVCGEQEVYDLLNIIEFDSTRKRMSVIVRTPAGKIVLLCKGADSVIYERLKKGSSQDSALNTTLDMLTTFAAEGLRTLVIAKADLPDDVYEPWAQKYHAASCAMTNRDAKMADVGEQIEKDLLLLGTTAIEDKLQDKVPQTIELLMAAGVKVWVLTGDKQETAINIGYACALLNNTMTIMAFDEVDPVTLVQKLQEYKRSADENTASPNPSDMGLVIQGGLLLSVLEEPTVAQLFLSLAMMCKAIICCRVSPLQKAQVVSLVKDNVESITLAIGDGANDVSMIQSANVGIGISGLEGLQAARASDYSIAQFHYLRRLLLVHGRWNYRRVARLILYSFYKNITLYLTQFFFCLMNGFSGQSLYDQWALALFNVWFTVFPIIILAIFDRDVEAERILGMDQFPELYQDGINRRLFNTSGFWKYVFNAIYHSCLAFFIPTLCLQYMTDSDGREFGLPSLGVLCYTVTLCIVTAKVSFETLSWTMLNYVFIGVSFALWFLFLFVYTQFWRFLKVSSFATWYGVPLDIVPTMVFWLTIIISTAVAMTRDFLFKYYRRNFNPELSHVIQVYERVAEAGQFPLTRFVVGKRYPHLLSKLETMDPKAGSQQFAPQRLDLRTGFGFSQEKGEAYVTRVWQKTRTKLLAITALSKMAARRSDSKAATGQSQPATSSPVKREESSPVKREEE